MVSEAPDVVGEGNDFCGVRRNPLVYGSDISPPVPIMTSSDFAVASRELLCGQSSSIFGAVKLSISC